jgi:hypothetical protein
MSIYNLILKTLYYKYEPTTVFMPQFYSKTYYKESKYSCQPPENISIGTTWCIPS